MRKLQMVCPFAIQIARNKKNRKKKLLILTHTHSWFNDHQRHSWSRHFIYSCVYKEVCSMRMRIQQFRLLLKESEFRPKEERTINYAISFVFIFNSSNVTSFCVCERARAFTCVFRCSLFMTLAIQHGR